MKTGDYEYCSACDGDGWVGTYDDKLQIYTDKRTCEKCGGRGLVRTRPATDKILSVQNTNNGVATGLLTALRFAAHKHRLQRRKDSDGTPYINHPIAVAEVLARIGGITELTALQAAILHDTLEDTQTTPQELDEHFGQQVRLLVQELTDDKSLPKQERKRLQIEHAPLLTIDAKRIKLADKICNLGDITPTQPPDWPLQRKLDYFDFAERVVAGCRGWSAELERHFDALLNEKRQTLETAA